MNESRIRQLAAPTEQQGKPRRGSSIGGIVLIVIGVLFLVDNFIPSFGFDDFWPCFDSRRRRYAVEHLSPNDR